jgi:Domain of unknown function (DUF5642)
MLNRVLVFACVGVLAACGSGGSSSSDIAKVDSVKSTFGPQFQVSSVAPTGIDPRLLAPQTLPQGMKFEPADCAKFATEQVLPSGLKGNMAATSAEGEGNRFIAMAVEMSEPVPFNDPGQACQKVGFGGGSVRGMVEVVEAPRIDGVRTLGTHRVLQTLVGGKPRTGELYNYVASFDTFMVIVTANPLVLPDKPVEPVNTERARELLTAAVSAVKG